MRTSHTDPPALASDRCVFLSMSRPRCAPPVPALPGRQQVRIPQHDPPRMRNSRTRPPARAGVGRVSLSTSRPGCASLIPTPRARRGTPPGPPVPACAHPPASLRQMETSLAELSSAELRISIRPPIQNHPPRKPFPIHVLKIVPIEYNLRPRVYEERKKSPLLRFHNSKSRFRSSSRPC